MAFDNDYWHALDKQAARNMDVSARDIGISHGAGDVLDGLKTNIMAGATHVELGFTGTGKGSLGQGSTTPEMFGRDKREAIRQLSKINDVTVSTHTSIGVQGLSGTTEQGFSDRAAQISLNEVKRTVDFAAEAAGGGPVVVHTSEFPVEISEKYKEFEIYPKEKGVKEEIVNLVNKETGKFMRFHKGEVFFEPEWQKNENGQFINAIGQTIEDENIAERIPVINEQTGTIRFREKRWGDIEKETEEHNKRHPDKKMTPGQFFVIEMNKTEMERAKPFAYSYLERYQSHAETLKKISEEYEAAKEVEEKVRDKARLQLYRLRCQDRIRAMQRNPEFVIPEDEKTSEAFKKIMDEIKLGLQHEKEGAIGYYKEIEKIKKLQETVVPVEELGIKRSAESLAGAAMYAYDKERAMKLKKPLFIAPENLFPETGYGSHPGELKTLILEARREMVNELKRRNITGMEAQRIANEHIKATFDIGHAYTWKKFFKSRPGESYEETEKRFKKWLLNEVDRLNKEGIIGHVHLADNLGYFDEHLTPGMGSAPLKEFVKKLKESGFKGKIIAEPGAQAQGELYDAMTGGWKEVVTSPMYRIGRRRELGWTEIENSYFGRTRTTSYMAGKYVPSEEYRGVEKGAPFWVGLGLE